jgi:lipopolysaccharide export system protein LptA
VRLIPFRLTIERLRTLALVAAGLLIAALVVLLTVSHWKSRFNLSEIPKKLGIDIEQEANGVTYTQSRGGHTLFKIHASKVVQLKAGGKALLHDVQIELYGADGSRVDRIVGNEFEYDQQAGVATAAGPVEITMMKPGNAPAVAPKAAPQEAAAKGTPLANAAQTVAAGQIQVKTSGLTFNQKTGVATTEQHVEFAVTQGTGSAMGATFDSNNGLVVLDHAVELTVQKDGGDAVIHARHAEFERTALLCTLNAAEAAYRNATATAGEAKILFRQDGSAVRLDAHNGFTLSTANGGHVAAPQGWLEFDEKNQPRRGHLEGGVKIDSVTGGRQAHGSSPVAELEFTGQGDLKHVHLERGVEMASEEDSAGAHISREWRSPVADVAFRAGVKGKTELDSLVGQGGVTMTGQTRRGDGTMSPSRMSADAVTTAFGPDGQLRQAVGTGRASVEQTTATGTVQTTTGDRLVANFYATKQTDQHGAAGSAVGQSAQIESATVDGNVVLVEKPAKKAGQPPQPELRATAAHAVYEGAGGWLHLTGSPRVVNGGLEMTADKVDVSEQAGNTGGDAFAHGNVKATWVNDGRGGASQAGANSSGSNSAGTVGLGGQSPAHVISAEGEFHQATGTATFKGNARLWQDANSVAAPEIVLDRGKRTLAAHGNGAAEPVRVVLLSAGGGPDGKGGADGKGGPDGKSGGAKGNAGQKPQGAGKPAQPSVIRVRGDQMWYSDVARRAVMTAASGGRVTAETGTATSTSDSVELVLVPAQSQTGSQAQGFKTGAQTGSQVGSQVGASQVDHMTAQGNVVLTSPGAQGDRHGTGTQLVYTGRTEQYVLTGTAAAPPKMSDPERGIVTGKALIFNSRDDSVSIEGSGEKTSTVTRAPSR